jgi:hypothetical protein
MSATAAVVQDRGSAWRGTDRLSTENVKPLRASVTEGDKEKGGIKITLDSAALSHMAREGTGGRLIRHARYFVLQLAESYLTPYLFRQILRRIERLAWHPT